MGGVNDYRKKPEQNIYLKKCCSCEYFPFDHWALLSLDHSFFGSEWQKRWCVLNNSIFYYFGSEKGLFEMPMFRNIIGS